MIIKSPFVKSYSRDLAEHIGPLVVILPMIQPHTIPQGSREHLASHLMFLLVRFGSPFAR